MSNAALRTDGETTIVLPHVAIAYWAQHDEDDEDIYNRVPIDDAELFVVEAGAERHEFNDDNFKEAGVSFLRALSLYWETRV